MDMLERNKSWSLWNSMILRGTLCNRRAITRRDTEKAQSDTEKKDLMYHVQAVKNINSPAFRREEQLWSWHLF